MTKIIILGAGKMGFSIASHLNKKGIIIEGFTNPTKPLNLKKEYLNYYLGDDSVIFNYKPSSIELVLALSDQYFRDKKKIFEKCTSEGYKFSTIIFDNVMINTKVEIGEGIIIFSMVNINSYTLINDLVVINSVTNIDHDNCIGENCYISPGVITTGSVTIGKNVFIGSGSTILPGNRIGDNSSLGANSLLTKDLPSEEVWYGNPATFIKKIILNER